MIIKKIHIYGFGKWQDYRLELPENKLTIVYGENETGKSTLREFLLFILFGLSPKKREFFRPKTGGRIGGRIEVWTEKQGTFTIERVHEKKNGEAVCYLADGNERGESWLHEQLDRMDEKTFAMIFSFSANDLNYLHNIKEEEIGEFLLGMGMAGTSAIHEAEKKLDQKLEQRFKPQGKKPPLNQQLAALETMEKKLQETEKQEEQYQWKKQQEKEFVAELASLQKKEKQTIQKENKLEKKLQASPLIFDYFAVQDELPPRQEVHPFPENGIERYTRLKDGMMPVKSELAVLEANEEEYMEKKKEIEKNMVQPDIQRDLEEFEDAAEKNKEKESQADYHNRELSTLQTKVEEEIEALNLGIGLEEMDELNLPFYTEEKWNSLYKEKQRMENELFGIEEKETEMENELRQLESEKTKLEKEAEQAVTNVKGESRQKQESGETEESQASQQEKSRLSTWILGAGVMVFLGLLIFSFSSGAGWLAMLAVLILAFSTGQWVWHRQSAKLTAQLAAAQQENESSYGISQPSLQLNYTDEQISRFKRESLQLQEKKKFIEEQRGRLQGRIEAERNTWPFLSGLEVEQWPKLYGRLQQVLFKYKQYISTRKEVERLQAEICSFEDKALALLKKLNQEGNSDKEDKPTEKALEKIETQKQLRGEWKQYEDRLAKTRGSIAACRQRLQPYQNELAALLEAAETETEEAFYSKGKRKQVYEEKKRHLASLYKQLKVIFPDSELKAMLKEAVPDQQDMELELNHEKAEGEDLRLRMEEARQQLADIRSSIENMENSEQLSELRHRFEVEQADFRESAKEWARYKLAKEKLAETKKAFRQTYFPAVMENTSEIFRFITGGRYVQVLLPDEGNGLLAENYQGVRFNVNELSKGTHDQLYVALKIALSENTSLMTLLPFLIDDAFVHFDQTRLYSIPKILEQTASSRQILWFTCNRMMKKEAGQYGFIDLEKKTSNSITAF